MANKFVFLLLLMLSSSQALRLLVFFPVPSKSHSILGHGVANRLLEAGHEVVHVTSFPSEHNQPKLKEISVKPFLDKIKSQTEKNEAFKLKNLIGKHTFGMIFFITSFFLEIQKQILEEPVVVELLNDRTEQFDAVILEWVFFDAIAGIAPLFQCPLIWYGSTEAHWQVLKIIDEIPNPAYSVDIFSSSRPPLSFIERLKELGVFTGKILLHWFINVPKEKAIFNEVFLPIAQKKGITMPSYDEAIYNGSLLLLNSHPSVGTPYRLPQNAKYIGGSHIDKNVSFLSKELLKIMDEAKHGVIYFSMGSNLKSSDWPESSKNDLLQMFGKLDQIVIWKYETDLKNVPSNVIIVNWAPQTSILKHPNLRLFISHGGQLSTLEAVHFGVQIIGIPVMGDQHVNMQSVVNKGFGIKVSIENNFISELNAAIKEILSNDKYKTKVKALSQIYHDRRDPGEELVYWVEHVVNTEGAPHLRSPALTVNFYQKLYLDALLIVIIFTVVVFLILLYLLHKLKLKLKKD